MDSNQLLCPRADLGFYREGQILKKWYILVYIGAKGAFRKMLGLVGLKWMSKNNTKGADSLFGEVV